MPIPGALVPILERVLAGSAGDLLFPNENGERQRHDVKKARMLREAFRKAGVVNGWRYLCRRKGCGYHVERAARDEGARCPKCEFKLWELGVPPRLRWMDLRHSCSTLHREAGADPLVVQLLLGHSPKSLTDSTYTHLSMEYQRVQLDKLRLD